MSRSKQLWVLMILTAITLATVYSFQPWLLHKTPAEVTPELWTLERISWALRAIIEAWAIIYLAQTQTRSSGQFLLVWALKIALIALIAITLGPVFVAIGEGGTIKAVLSATHFRVWTYGIALYGPLMMAAVAVAYKIQPYDIEHETNNALEAANAKLTELSNSLTSTKQKLVASEQRADKAEQELNGLTERVNAAESQLSKMNGKAVRLFDGDKKQRIETAHELWPDLPQRAIATITDSATGYVNQVLKSQNGTGH